MKAAVVEKPGVLTVRDVPMPQAGPYDCLCELLFGATCTGTDQHLIAGRFPWPIRYPTVLGHESVGRVVEAGAKVRNFRRGDLIARVGMPEPPGGQLSVSWGGFAEYGVAHDHEAMRQDGLPSAQWGGYRANKVIPAEVDPAGATMFITWRETLSYVMRMGVGKGSTLLVIGSGGNGLSFAAHASNRGAARVAMVGNAAREAAARRCGVKDYFDYRADDLTERAARACPDGFDFIIDAVGKAGQADRLLPVLKPGGAIGIYGIDDYGRCLLNPTRARGTFTYSNKGYDEPETHDEVIEYVRQGRLDASVWLDLKRTFPLAEIGQAFEAIIRRETVKALVRLHEPR